MAIQPRRGASSTASAAAAAPAAGATSNPPAGVSQTSAAAARAPAHSDAASAGAGADPRARGRPGQALERAAGDRPALVVGHRQAVGQGLAQVGQRAALLGAREDRAVQGPAQLEREVAPQAPQRRQARPDPPRGGRGAAAAHGVDAAERLVDDEGQGIEVGLLAHLSPGRLLGRHVGQRADDVARDGQRVVADHAGDAEVRQLGHGRPVVRPVGHDHVARFDVAMDDAAAVGVGQRVGQGDTEAQHVAVGELAVAHELRQRAPAHELGDEVEGLVVATGLVEGDDPRMRQARRRARLPLGPCRHRVVVHGDALDRHGALEALVLGQPHHAEAARADLAHQPVAIEHASRVGAGAQVARGGGVRGLVGGPHRVLASPSAACLLAVHDLVRAAKGPVRWAYWSFPKPNREQLLSFFDEGDEPTRVRSRPARPRRPATAARGGGAGAPPDRQTARLRQAVGLGALVILAILVVLGFKGCLDSRKDNALKDYNRNVTAVINDSDQSVGKPFFQRMSDGAAQLVAACRCRSTSCGWPPRTTSSARRPSTSPATWARPSATSSSCSTCAPRA